MQRANKNKKATKKAVQKAAAAQPSIGNKRGRDGAQKQGPAVSIPVQSRAAFVETMSKSKDSCLMKIRQPFHDVQNLAVFTGGNVIVNGTLATNSGNKSPLCPSALNGAMQTEGQIWCNYQFESISFFYTPTCPTTQAGALCFGCVDQPYSIADGDITNFSTARSVQNAVTTSVYQPTSWSIRLNKDDRVDRICDGAVTGGTLDKLLYNKVFFGVTDIPAPAVTTINYGYLDIEITVRYSQLVSNQGFTLGHISSLEEKLVLASIRDVLFPKKMPLIVPSTEPIDGVAFLLGKLGIGKESDARSASGSVKSWVSTGR